jgi:uncharacterized protein involved in exopolysaccharide biosynthesis
MKNSAREIHDHGDPSSPFSLEMNLDGYVGMIRKYRILISLICGIAVCATAVASLLSPHMYSATAALVPPISLLQGQADLGRGLGNAEGAFLRKALGGTSIVDLYAGILGSRSIRDAVIEKLHLGSVYEETSVSRTRLTLQRNTVVKASNEGILSITVKDRDPQRAAAIANAYMEELDRQNKMLYMGQATSKRVFVENRLKEIQAELSHVEKLSAHDVAVKEMVFELLTREYEIAKIEEARSMPTIQMLDAAVPPDERLPRGTVKKTVLAGGLSLISGLFLAHLLEYGRNRRLR